VPDILVKRQRSGTRLHSQSLEQKLAAAAVSLHRRRVISELAITHHQPAMKLLGQAVDLDSDLVYAGGLLPQVALLVTPRETIDGPQKPFAQDLAFLDRPGFLNFLRKKMPRIELTQSRQSLSRTAVIRISLLQLTLECPHIHPELPAIQRKFAARHHNCTRRTEQPAKTIQGALEGVVTGVTFGVGP
jgi:hypothetical protein